MPRKKGKKQTKQEIFDSGLDYDPDWDLSSEEIERDDAERIRKARREFFEGKRIYLGGQDTKLIANELRFLLKVLPEKKKQIIELTKNLILGKKYRFKQYENAIKTGQVDPFIVGKKLYGNPISIDRALWKILMGLRKEAMEKIAQKS